MSYRNRLRIGIDLHVAGGIFQGSRTHCLELFSRVIRAIPECEFIVIGAAPEALLSFSDAFALPNVIIFPIPKRSAVERLLWQLPRVVKHFGVSLLHTQYITPPFLPCAAAVTVHDILFESHPQYFEKIFVARSRILVRRSIRQSDLIFTVSDYSCREIATIYSVPAERIRTIPNGVDPGRFFAGDEGVDSIRTLGLTPRRYYLTVGRLEPRKNHANLLRAWANLSSPRPPLVIVGQRDFRYSETFGLLHALQLEHDILILEEISDLTLPALYRHARGFVYSSHAEGFGMPLLEAMASGVPIISSPQTALSEIGGDAVLWADPNNASDISRAVATLDRDESLRQELIRRGLERSQRYSWDRAAAIVRDAYLSHLLPAQQSH